MSAMANIYIDVEELVHATLRSATITKPADEVVHEVARYTEEAGWKSPTEWSAYRQRFLEKVKAINTAVEAHGTSSIQAAAARLEAYGYALDLFGIEMAEVMAKPLVQA